MGKVNKTGDGRTKKQHADTDGLLGMEAHFCHAKEIKIE